MHIKTVKVTNPKNVLVQIPGFVVAQWGIQLGDTLEVSYAEGQVTIRQAIHGGGNTTKEGQGVA